MDAYTIEPRRHWCNTCHGFTGPNSPCYQGDDALYEGEKEERYLRDAFLRDATESQADKYALFAPRVRDNKNGGTCMQTMGEVLFDALDYKDYIQRAMQVLLNAANGKGTQRDAQMLLEEVAASWAGRQVE